MMSARIHWVALCVVLMGSMFGLVGCNPNDKDQGPGSAAYNARHHINETQGAMPNPDPAPERRGPGRPPAGKYVSFHVTAAKSMGTVIVNYKIGDVEQTFQMSGTKHWGSIVDVGTPVWVLAAPDGEKKADGTFKHGIITVRITREPANESEGGRTICEDANGTDTNVTGGAQCAGVV